MSNDLTMVPYFKKNIIILKSLPRKTCSKSPSRHEQGRMKHFLASPRNDALMPCFRNAVLTNISFACRNLGCFCSTHSASTSRRQAEKCEFICELTS
jgi:hypothetical protein